MVTTQFGSHFQAIVGEDEAMTRRSRVISKQVHVVPVHGHDQIPECSFLRDPCDSDLLPPNIVGVITGCEVQMVMTSILCFDEGFEAATKIKTFKSGLCRALP